MIEIPDVHIERRTLDHATVDAIDLHPARRPDRRLRCRDEIAYRSSDTFDIRRTNQPRLRPIFGFGAHRCIGEALARAELEKSLSVITARIPQIPLNEAPRSGPSRNPSLRVSPKP